MPKDRAEPIRVAVIADNSGAAAEIARALRDTGHPVRPYSLTARNAHDRVSDLRPSVVLMRTGPRSFALAAAFARAACEGDLALVLLTPSGSRQAIKLAAETGAFVHLVEPVPSQALVAAIHLAAARAEEVAGLKTELRKTRQALKSRTMIEEAKLVLMRRFGLSEEEAHRRLQRESRNRNRKLVDTAWHVVRADAALSAQSRRTKRDGSSVAG